MKRGAIHLRVGWQHFWRQLGKVVRNPVLLVLTLIGNLVLFAGAGVFFLVEHEVNPKVSGIGDALWWAFVTITTVGYGDIFPVTTAGRFVAAGMMLTGGVLFLSFIALLSSAFVEVELQQIELEVSELRRKVSTVAKHLEKEH